MSDAYLDIREISKRFGSFSALRNISFSLAKGEFVCLLGPSGCGKTTLLRIVAWLESPDEGHVLLQGRDITRIPPAERRFGIVFQSYALFPNMTARKNIAYGLACRGMDAEATDARVREVLRLVHLEHLGDKYPAQMSGGQQQRVALARALAPSPEMLLLDEPLSALDAKVRAELRQEIRSLQKELGITTVMVTHDQEEALTMADRVVVMNEAELEQIGTPTQIYERPASVFVADFIGTINFIERGDRLEAIRPEHIRVLDAASRDGHPATIRSVEFRGPFYRMSLCQNEQLLVADVPAGRMEGWRPRENDAVRISIPEEFLMRYPVR